MNQDTLDEAEVLLQLKKTNSSAPLERVVYTTPRRGGWNLVIKFYAGAGFLLYASAEALFWKAGVLDLWLDKAKWVSHPPSYALVQQFAEQEFVWFACGAFALICAIACGVLAFYLYWQSGYVHVTIQHSRRFMKPLTARS